MKGKGIFEYALITVGVVLMAVGISAFYARFTLVTGGFTGLSIIINELGVRLGFNAPIWLTNLALNAPLFIIGSRVKGLRFMARTLYATTLLSAAIYFADMLPALDIDLTIAAVFGGALNGVGLGLVFRCMGSTGGTDLIANIVNKYHPHISVQRILFAIDSCIIGLGFFIFGPQRAMYAVIAVFVVTKVLQNILEGMSFAKAAFIISAKPEEISTELMQRLSRGVTGLLARGMYTGGDKKVILCVVSSKEIIEVKSIVCDIDPAAFVMVTDVREVLGEGFQAIGAGTKQ